MSTAKQNDEVDPTRRPHPNRALSARAPGDLTFDVIASAARPSARAACLCWRN